MHQQYFESASGPQLRTSRFVAGGSTNDGRLEVDDFRPQLHLTLHGPNDLVVTTILRFEVDAEAPGAALRLLSRPGTISGTVVHELPLAQLTSSTTVALNVGGLAPGRYALWTDALFNFSATAVWLVDAYTGLRTNLRQEPIYVFTAVAAAPGRFWLHLLPMAAAGHSLGAERLMSLSTAGLA